MTAAALSCEPAEGPARDAQLGGARQHEFRARAGGREPIAHEGEDEPTDHGMEARYVRPAADRYGWDHG
jgi:hypothetical protein